MSIEVEMYFHEEVKRAMQKLLIRERNPVLPLYFNINKYTKVNSSQREIAIKVLHKLIQERFPEDSLYAVDLPNVVKIYSITHVGITDTDRNITSWDFRDDEPLATM